MISFSFTLTNLGAKSEFYYIEIVSLYYREHFITILRSFAVSLNDATTKQQAMKALKIKLQIPFSISLTDISGVHILRQIVVFKFSQQLLEVRSTYTKDFNTKQGILYHTDQILLRLLLFEKINTHIPLKLSDNVEKNQFHY